MSKGPINIGAGVEQLLEKTDIDALFDGRGEFGRRFSEGEGGNRRVAGRFHPDRSLEELVAVEVTPEIGGTEIRINPAELTISGRLTGYASQRARGQKELSDEKALAITERVLGYLGKCIRDEREK